MFLLDWQNKASILETGSSSLKNIYPGFFIGIPRSFLSFIISFLAGYVSNNYYSKKKGRLFMKVISFQESFDFPFDHLEGVWYIDMIKKI